MSFRRWLLVQVDRDDPVGDLARDTAEEGGCWSRGHAPSGLRRHMEDVHNAFPPALAALDRAEAEWRMLRGLRLAAERLNRGAGRISTGSDRP